MGAVDAWLNDHNQQLNHMLTYIAQIEAKNNRMEVTARNQLKLLDAVDSLLAALTLSKNTRATLEQPDLASGSGLARATKVQLLSLCHTVRSHRVCVCVCVSCRRRMRWQSCWSDRRISTSGSKACVRCANVVPSVASCATRLPVKQAYVIVVFVCFILGRVVLLLFKIFSDKKLETNW